MRKFTSDEVRAFVSAPLFDAETILRKDASWPRISIVTPSYNQGKFIERTILSVLNQNYPNLEYIILDGGSTDGSVEIIRKYERYLAYWVTGKDGGQSAAIRQGFDMCTGEICAYLNSDDLYSPGALHKVAQIFRQDAACDLVFGNTGFIDADDAVVGECRFTKFHFATLIYEGTNLHQPGAFWTREIYERIGGMNPKYRFCMDYDLFCRAGQVGRFRHIRSHLANFRLHSASKTVTILPVGRMEHEEIASRYRAKNNVAYLRYRRLLCQVRRLTLYIAQGDVGYVLRGILRRTARKVAGRVHW